MQTSEYGAIISAAGFEDVVVQDRTDQFITMLEQDLEKLQQRRSAFEEHFSASDFDALETRWTRKLKR